MTIASASETTPASTLQAPFNAQNHGLSSSPKRTMPSGKKWPSTKPTGSSTTTASAMRTASLAPSVAANSGDSSRLIAASSTGASGHRRWPLARPVRSERDAPRPAPSSKAPMTTVAATLGWPR